MTDTAWAQQTIATLHAAKTLVSVEQPTFDFSRVTIGTSPLCAANVLMTTGRDGETDWALFAKIIQAAGFPFDGFTYNWAHGGSVTLGRKLDTEAGWKFPGSGYES